MNSWGTPWRIELSVHVNGLLVGDVGVLRAVDQQRRRILGRDVADRAERVESLRFAVGVMVGDLLGPEAILPAVEIDDSAGSRRRLRDRRGPDGGAGLSLGDQGLTAVERIGPAVPGAGDVAVSPERDQCRGTRLDPVAASQGEIAARRAAEHGDLVGPGAERRGTFGPDPGERVLHVVEDRRQLRLRSQAVIDRHDHIARLDQFIAERPVDPARSPMIRAPPWIQTATGNGSRDEGRITSALIAQSPTVL